MLVFYIRNIVVQPDKLSALHLKNVGEMHVQLLKFNHEKLNNK